MEHQKTDCRKIQYKKVTFEHKLFVIAQITNGQISINYASKKYAISRSSLNYWIKKYANLAQNIKWFNMRV
jgi:transposase-like protein